jgi:cell division septum initiation protein DivIVA
MERIMLSKTKLPTLLRKMGGYNTAQVDNAIERLQQRLNLCANERTALQFEVDELTEQIALATYKPARILRIADREH